MSITHIIITSVSIVVVTDKSNIVYTKYKYLYAILKLTKSQTPTDLYILKM